MSKHYTGKNLAKLLVQNGFQLIRVQGSHHLIRKAVDEDGSVEQAQDHLKSRLAEINRRIEKDTQ